MVKIIKPQQSFLNDLLGRVGQGLQGYGQNQFLQQQNQQQMQEQQQKQAEELKFGILPTDLPEVRKAKINRVIKPTKTQMLYDLVSGQSPNTLGDSGYANIDINGQQMPVNIGNITPEMRQQMEDAGIEVPLPGGYGSVGESISSYGRGVLATGLGLPADLLRAGLSASEYLGFAPTALNIDPTKAQSIRAKYTDELSNLEPGTPAYENKQHEIDIIDQSLKDRGDPYRAVDQALPTSSNLKKWAKKGSQGTIFEPYLSPQTEGQRFLEGAGDLTALALNPQGWKKGASGIAKQVLKSTGVGLGAKAAGWLAEKSTGSKTAGDLISNGAVLAYNLFPGSISKAASERYDQFNDKVIKPALKQNKNVPTQSMKASFDAAKRKLDRLVPNSEAYNKVYPYVAKMEEMLVPTNVGVNPEGLWKNAKEMNSALAKIPTEGQEIFKDLVSLQKDALTKFGNGISKNSGNILKEADSLYKAARGAEKATQSVTDKILPRNLGTGTMLYLSGGYPFALGAGYAASAYNQAMNGLKSPEVRKLISQAFSASAKNNVRALNNIIKKLNTKVEEVDPAQAQLLIEYINSLSQQ